MVTADTSIRSRRGAKRVKSRVRSERPTRRTRRPWSDVVPGAAFHTHLSSYGTGLSLKGHSRVFQPPLIFIYVQSEAPRAVASASALRFSSFSLYIRGRLVLKLWSVIINPSVQVKQVQVRFWSLPLNVQLCETTARGRGPLDHACSDGTRSSVASLIRTPSPSHVFVLFFVLYCFFSKYHVDVDLLD